MRSPRNMPNAMKMFQMAAVTRGFELDRHGRGSAKDVLLDVISKPATLQELAQRIAAKYGDEMFCYSVIMTILKKMGAKREDLRILRDKKVLDLGCGSVLSIDNFNGGFDPWLCRCLHEIGAEVIGIDVYKQVREAFKSFEKDLSVPGGLNFLADASFDFVVCKSLLSFTLDVDEHLSDFLFDDTDKKTRENMRNEIFLQTKRLLREGGLFIATDGDASLLIFKKENNELIKKE